MINKIRNLADVVVLKTEHLKKVNGGYYPTNYQFCCVGSQEMWIKIYPSTAEYSCENISC